MGNLSEGGFLRGKEAPRQSEGEVTRESRVELAQERLVPPYLKLKEGVNPKNFISEPGYSREMVEDDEAALDRRLRLKIAPAQKSAEAKARAEYGELNEAAVFVTLQALLGPEAQVIPTSKVDDLLGGMDMAVVWRNQGEPIAIGIDVASFINDAANKMNQAFQTIDHGVPNEIRYAEIPGKTGLLRQRLNNIARATITLEGNSKVEAVGKILAESGSEARVNERLGRSSLAYLMLYQVEAQLRVMERYARERKKDKIAEAYGAALQKVEGVLNRLSPEARTRMEEALSSDSTYVAMATHAWEGVQKRKLPAETRWPIH